MLWIRFHKNAKKNNPFTVCSAKRMISHLMWIIYIHSKCMRWVEYEAWDSDVAWGNVVWLWLWNHKMLSTLPLKCFHILFFFCLLFLIVSCCCRFFFILFIFVIFHLSLLHLLEFFGFVFCSVDFSCSWQVNVNKKVLMKWSYCCATNVLLAWRSTVNRIIFMPMNFYYVYKNMSEYRRNIFRICSM